MNSLHTTRNTLAELHTYMEMEHTGKHILNIEHCDESQTLRTYFYIKYFQEKIRGRKPSTKASKMNAEPPRTPIEVTFII